MYLVAIAWMYVVLMMGVAEALSSNGTVLGALVTVVLYGLLPLSVLLYIMGTPLRRRARVQQELHERQEQEQEQQQQAQDRPTSPAVAGAAPGASSAAPDGSGMPPGDAITAKGEKP